MLKHKQIPIFNLEVPVKMLINVPSELLDPRNSWDLRKMGYQSERISTIIY